MASGPGQPRPDAQPILSNADIADRLAGLAQLLSRERAHFYKAKAYRQAAANIRTFPESLARLVHSEADLTRYPGIGEAIAGAIREIVLTGSLGKLEKLKAEATPALAGITQYPRLDPQRVLRIYKKLGISSTEELRRKLENGEIQRIFGARMAQHVEHGLVEARQMLLYRADPLSAAIREFLLGRCGVRRAELAGACRRRVEVVEELAFVIQTEDFAGVIARLESYGGRTPLVSSGDDEALFALPSGVLLRIRNAGSADWGRHMIECTGSPAHLEKLSMATGSLRVQTGCQAFPTEAAFYRNFGLDYIQPELREGHDEIDRAATGTLPVLVTAKDIRGELHAHTTASDGANSIEEMAAAARALGYQYTGITDHSQSLKIARGVSIEDLWAQIRHIDRLNAGQRNFRILKSAEVDILADGSLDYPDDLLRELDYTVCSIHSRFSLDRQQQTDRILRAMENRYFHILGHATGRLLLKRPGYEIDMPRVIERARQNGCFFEINASPDRLDISAGYARQAAAAGVMIAISTDAHSTGEFPLIRCGLDQARRAGLEKSAVLNCQPWEKLERLFRR